MLTKEALELDFQVERMTKSWKGKQVNIQSSFEECRFSDYVQSIREFYTHPLSSLLENVTGGNNPDKFATRIVESFEDMLDKVSRDIESSGWALSKVEHVEMDAKLIDAYLKKSRQSYGRYLPLRKLTMPDGRTSGFVVMLTMYGGRTHPRPASIDDVDVHLVFAKISEVNHDKITLHHLENSIEHNQSLIDEILRFENELKRNDQENLVVEETNTLLKSIKSKLLIFQQEKEILTTTNTPPSQDTLRMEEQFLRRFGDIYQINIDSM